MPNLFRCETSKIPFSTCTRVAVILAPYKRLKRKSPLGAHIYRSLTWFLQHEATMSIASPPLPPPPPHQLRGHLCPEMHLTLNWGTSYKTDLLVIFI